MGRLTHTIKKSLFVTGVALLLVGIAGLISSGTVSAQAGGDCSDNSIVKCGVGNAGDLVAKARANQPADLQAIMSNFNVKPDQYDAFARDAKMGTAKRDGTIIYNGQVVGRDAWSIGRSNFNYSTPYYVGGKAYYKSANKDVLKQDDMPAMLWFNEQGKLTAAILTACGNPMGANTVTPSYSCGQINKETVSGQADTYRFTATAPVSNGATVSKVVYDFGDGSTETRTNPADAVTHTYSKPGDYTAKVTVYFKLPDGREVSASGGGCATQITVKAPPAPKTASWQCTGLTATRKEGDSNPNAYRFTANASVNNARLVNADFNFGDGITQSAVAPSGSSANTVSYDHTYAGAGNFTATATLRFEVTNGADGQGKSTDATCTASVAIAQPPAPTPELPKTGAAGVAGLFAGTGALGALGYRWRASRRLTKVDELADRLMKR